MGARLNDFDRELMDAMPQMMRWAMSYVRNADAARDLIQDTLVRALTYRHQFEAGTNLKGWLSMIMRNVFIGQKRRSHRVIFDTDAVEAYRGTVEPAAPIRLEAADALELMDDLPVIQSAAMVEVLVMGETYDDAAEHLGCAVGTIKSRVSRARSAVIEGLEGRR